VSVSAVASQQLLTPRWSYLFSSNRFDTQVCQQSLRAGDAPPLSRLVAIQCWILSYILEIDQSADRATAAGQSACLSSISQFLPTCTAHLFYSIFFSTSDVCDIIFMVGHEYRVKCSQSSSVRVFKQETMPTAGKGK
jgi:hypothetical protein